jgi:hypothetical protein
MSDLPKTRRCLQTGELAHSAPPSAHAGARTPARCRRIMLLKAVNHQQLIASSWGLAVQLGRALPGHCPWGPRPSCTASPGATEGAQPR